MAKRARRVKTDYASGGYQHREHRSKKNRRRIHWTTEMQAKDRKRHLEDLKLKDLES